MFEIFIKNIEEKIKLEEQLAASKNKLYSIKKFKEDCLMMEDANEYNEKKGYSYIFCVFLMFFFIVFSLSYFFPILNKVVGFFSIFFGLYSIVYFLCNLIIVFRKLKEFKILSYLKKVKNKINNEIENEELFYNIVSNIQKVQNEKTLKEIEYYLEESDSAIKQFKIEKEKKEKAIKEEAYRKEKEKLLEEKNKKEMKQKIKSRQNNIKNKYVRIENIN